MIFAASQAGVTIFNSITVEDIVFKENRVCGLVINWTAAKRLSMMVDPLAVMAEYVVDATGHPSEILHFVKENAQAKLKTTTGEIIGERPMWVDRAEQECVTSTDEYFPGLFACGMSAVNATGKHRMGAIFSGMFNSGHKLADIINEKLLSRKK